MGDKREVAGKGGQGNNQDCSVRKTCTEGEGKNSTLGIRETSEYSVHIFPMWGENGCKARGRRLSSSVQAFS